MRIQILIPLFFLLGLVEYSYSQTLFSKRYSFNIPGDIFSSILVSGDTIFMTGVSGDTSMNFAEIQSPKNLSALFDLQGNPISHAIYNGDFHKDYETFVQHLIKTRNGFALCGSTISSTYNALLIEYDSVMNVTIVKEFPYPDSITGLDEQSLVQLADGSLIMAGDIQHPAGDVSLSVLKIDTNSNIEWWKAYPSLALIDRYPSILPLTDTTLLIGFEHNNEISYPQAVTSHTKFMIIDTAGNIKSQWQDNNDSTFAPYGLLRTKDGGYAYCGRYSNRMSAPYGNIITNGNITKLNSNFHLIWRYINGDIWNTSDATILDQLRELPDSSLIAVGVGQQWNSLAQLYTPTGWITKVSSYGDSIWSRMYRGIPGTLNNFDDNEFNDFQLLPDGGIIVCGSSTDGAATNLSQQAWLIRLDSMGCLIPGCDTLRATDIKENNETIGVKVYPNPASNMVYVLIKTDAGNKNFSLKVFDVTGTLMAQELSAPADITYLLNTSAYASGMYFVEITDTEQHVLATRKFVKE